MGTAKVFFLIWMAAAASTKEGGLSNGITSGTLTFRTEAACAKAAAAMQTWTSGTWVKADCFPDVAP